MLRADEWLVDIAHADASRLTSEEHVRALCDDVVRAFRLTLVAPPLVRVFPGTHGITALFLLSESHLAIHTWPEKAGALLSLGTCRVGVPEQFAWADVVRTHFGGGCDVVVREVKRSIP